MSHIHIILVSCSIDATLKGRPTTSCYARLPIAAPGNMRTCFCILEHWLTNPTLIFNSVLLHGKMVRAFDSRSEIPGCEIPLWPLDDGFTYSGFGSHLKRHVPCSIGESYLSHVKDPVHVTKNNDIVSHMYCHHMDKRMAYM